MLRNDTSITLAKALSVILHPAVIPVYLMIILISQGLLLYYATTQARIYFMVVIILNTVIVPLVCISLFNRLRIWRDNPQPDFRERILPMVVMTICYGACLLMIRDVPFALPVRKMLTAGMGSLLLGLVTSFFWKVSLHMIAQGAAVAFIGIMAISNPGRMMPVLCVAIALSALLASAQLYLGKHNALQVAAGFAGGFAVTLLTVYLI